MNVGTWQDTKKNSECFESLSNGNIINYIKSLPFVTSMNSVQALSLVEGLPRGFQHSARSRPDRFCRLERLNGLNKRSG